MKLLIADDDKQICEGIVEGINWDELGINEVKSATNGIEAFEIFQKDYPEIIVTDIKMPGIDGLELFKKVKKLKPSSRVIIISGYSDFDYLKTAIQYGAVDYILKPIRVKNLIALINKAKEDIIKEKTTEDEFLKYQKIYISKFIEDIYKGKINDRSIILEGLEQYFGFDAHGFLVIVVFETDPTDGECYTETYCSEGLKQYFPEMLEKPSDLLFWKVDITRGSLLIKTSNSMCLQYNFINELKKTIAQINCDFKSKFGITMSVGVSRVGTVSDISGLFRQASEALECKFYTGSESIHFYGDFMLNKQAYMIPQQIKEQLIQLIADLNTDTACNLILNEYQLIIAGKSCSIKSIIDISQELLHLLSTVLKSKGFDNYGYYEVIIMKMKEEARLEILEDYKNLVLKCYRSVLSDLSDQEKVSDNKCILKSVEYIKKNYHKDLNVKAIAQLVGKTPNYFCHVFKKEMDMSFTDYLNKTRIKKAKTLIQDTDKPIYEICMEVGFKDYAYFSRIFKKYELCSPTEIRRKQASRGI